MTQENPKTFSLKERNPYPSNPRNRRRHYGNLYTRRSPPTDRPPNSRPVAAFESKRRRPNIKYGCQPSHRHENQTRPSFCNKSRTQTVRTVKEEDWEQWRLRLRNKGKVDEQKYRKRLQIWEGQRDHRLQIQIEGSEERGKWMRITATAAIAEASEIDADNNREVKEFHTRYYKLSFVNPRTSRLTFCSPALNTSGLLGNRNTDISTFLKCLNFCLYQILPYDKHRNPCLCFYCSAMCHPFCVQHRSRNNNFDMKIVYTYKMKIKLLCQLNCKRTLMLTVLELYFEHYMCSLFHRGSITKNKMNYKSKVDNEQPFQNSEQRPSEQFQPTIMFVQETKVPHNTDKIQTGKFSLAVQELENGNQCCKIGKKANIENQCYEINKKRNTNYDLYGTKGLVICPMHYYITCASLEVIPRLINANLNLTNFARNMLRPIKNLVSNTSSASAREATQTKGKWRVHPAKGRSCEKLRPTTKPRMSLYCTVGRKSCLSPSKTKAPKLYYMVGVNERELLVYFVPEFYTPVAAYISPTLQLRINTSINGEQLNNNNPYNPRRIKSRVRSPTFENRTAANYFLHLPAGFSQELLKPTKHIGKKTTEPEHAMGIYNSKGKRPRCRNKRDKADQVQKKQSDIQQSQNRDNKLVDKHKAQERGEHTLHNTSCEQKGRYKRESSLCKIKARKPRNN